ncbi:hypothetical protein I7I53_09930 [Histoplasma capsulatum var. duboisii H88]|uniref:Uncharacterized protein n=1 Tax=Ajellomyces capsulatus (strain H88) TaxID=544711 RepID=A0A8A1LAS5_AJEC8|nr:hypothetical protein I7I53_09930 [Histoplasma capsulatum var. duboisii H88]
MQRGHRSSQQMGNSIGELSIKLWQPGGSKLAARYRQVSIRIAAVTRRDYATPCTPACSSGKLVEGKFRRPGGTLLRLANHNNNNYNNRSNLTMVRTVMAGTKKYVLVDCASSDGSTSSNTSTP